MKAERDDVARMSRFIDDLNREKARRFSDATPEEEDLFAAARAVKSLGPGAPLRRSFAPRLLRTVGWPAARVRLEAGLVRGAALLAVTASVAGAVLIALSFRPSIVAGYVREAAAASADPASAGIPGFSGIYHNDYARRDLEVSFLAPDRSYVRDTTSGRVWAENGQVRWTYDPTGPRATIDYGPLPPGPPAFPYVLTSIGAGGVDELLQEAAYSIVVGRGRAPTPAATREVFAESVGSPWVLGSYDTVAGRPARIIKQLVPKGTGLADSWFWVDTETHLVLRHASVDATGRASQVSGYTAFSLGAPADPTIFDPAIPAGVPVTRSWHGDLAGLARQVGLEAWDLGDLPGGWSFQDAVLTRYPPEESGEWQLCGYYGPDDPVPWASGLVLAVSDRAPTVPEFGEEVEIAPGIAGRYATGQLLSSPSIVTWSNGGLFYSLDDSGSFLTREELLALAGSLLADHP